MDEAQGRVESAQGAPLLHMEVNKILVTDGECNLRMGLWTYLRNFNT